MHAPSAPIIYSFANPEELVDSLASFIVKAQKESIEKKGRFTIALSGGSLPQQLSGLVGKHGVKWDKWLVTSTSNSIERIYTPIGLLLMIL